MPKLLDRLNPQQLAAVTLPGRHALILAGAGSGKTRVLTTRIAWLLQAGQATPSGILAVTFTNKAAKEMLARLSAMLPINTRGMWIGTFHGLCNRMLRAHHHDAGLPALFQILDSADQLSAIKRLLKALNVDDEKFPPRELQHFINARKEAGLRAGAVEAWDDYTRRRVDLYRAYEEQCQREGVVDFAELLLRCHELLEFNEPIRRHYQARFRHILVDEFQDTNPLQYRWLKLLAGATDVRPHAALPPGGAAPGLGGSGAAAGACLFAVGDDDQSIYAFRGADVGNMRDFEREFAADNVIRLEQNYRSHGNILDAANAVIRHNAARLGKNLWTEAGAGEPLRVFEAASDHEEARWIVEEIRALVAEGLSRGEIALLYRSNAQSRVLEHALFSAGIAYRVYGGLRFFERQEVKHALAYLRLIANSDDDTAFMRVVNFPARGIGARSLEVLHDAARAAGTSLHGATGGLTGKAGAALGGFITLLARLRTACEGLTLPEMVEQVVELSGLRQHYATEREGQERLANLDELVNAAAGFVAEEGDALPPEPPEPDQAALVAGGAPAAGDAGTAADVSADGLSAFLTHAALEAGEHQADESQPAVQLMTVHAAKGLEFGAVFISGVEEGLFPHENAVTQPDGLEEERRLMYVAITRAQRRLYLSFAQTRMLHGHVRYSLRSRFLDEIPPQLLKWLTPQMRGGAAAARPFGAAGGYGGGYGSYGGYAGNRGGNGGGRQGGGVSGGAAQVSGGGPGLRVGQTVSHPRFGQGVIVAAEGSGNDARVQVNFGREGVKWLALAVAKLTPA
ncbi:MAG: UvrD-helicase domain-containing protein [Betaproteobacteria bacterium]|nr:UvrD-helicase domain-containing protein [Betaproteobacteria bacterium]